jgi:DNA-binding HxlR family transcriptional regulator
MSDPGDTGNNQELGRIAGIWKMLGKRWTLQILDILSSREATRFNELKRSLAGISGTILSERLLELEREGLVTKKIYGAVPSRVEYRLTASARDLENILAEFGRWCASRNSIYLMTN